MAEIRQFCGPIEYTFDGRYIRKYCGPIIYEIDGENIREYCGPIKWQISGGRVSDRMLLALMVTCLMDRWM